MISKREKGNYITQIVRWSFLRHVRLKSKFQNRKYRRVVKRSIRINYLVDGIQFRVSWFKWWTIHTAVKSLLDTLWFHFQRTAKFWWFSDHQKSTEIILSRVIRAITLANDIMFSICVQKLWTCCRTNKIY